MGKPSPSADQAPCFSQVKLLHGVIHFQRKAFAACHVFRLATVWRTFSTQDIVHIYNVLALDVWTVVEGPLLLHCVALQSSIYALM